MNTRSIPRGGVKLHIASAGSYSSARQCGAARIVVADDNGAGVLAVRVYRRPWKCWVLSLNYNARRYVEGTARLSGTRRATSLRIRHARSSLVPPGRAGPHRQQLCVLRRYSPYQADTPKLVEENDRHPRACVAGVTKRHLSARRREKGSAGDTMRSTHRRVRL